MWSVVRSRSFSSSPATQQQWKLGFSMRNRSLSSATVNDGDGEGIRGEELLKLEEVETILKDVKADNVKVIPIPKHVDFADFMVVATGRSAWHVRNIAQALIYKVKQKQKGSKRMLLPSVEGQEGGKWIVIDSGKLVIHALDEKVRAYYNLERLWSTDASNQDHGLVQGQDLDKAFLKVRPKNNSKKRPSTSA
ncbi:PREDICTED: protein Iojap-related, mitochondrial [Nicotiana attenuata]|uniref:Protein iojap-related, mitochondrial n=1 Tax=Nicotiana attenuata TaxID=49451 RepID=A0A1J6KF57_NICAT|nr:PREDICTED: protein Iojap-related, mitochondrial [Nicotiana attenuata]OIT21451.1 protein iojap-related, mitochondrial [Nicotiana attenuata]